MIFIFIDRICLAQNFVLLDPGHGGSDNGAPGVCGINEKFLNLDYALDAYDKIDDDDTHYWISYSTRDDDDDYLSTTARYQMANNLNNDQIDAFGYAIPYGGVHLFLSVHCNSNAPPAAPGAGTEVYAPTGNETEIRIKRSKICATVLLQSHINETRAVFFNALSRHTKQDNYTVLIGT